ncbi:MAG: asparagine synthase (glutamine-hydrolyzing) [Burkholderiales bacterium 35-55-47]|jgi:asparagine synthase (glutamine-hydrolysing)|nr:MAG: asparagine synthase (glutamine-hydrolyzing) [Burkholderiales bacterium 35-55-47]OZA98930.1 MAG: asparagine synthase (glutamine-hydrolyzing) [Burkholderiales bacterium 39-55-53]
MCGISGFLSENAMSDDIVIGILKSMNDSIRHRGPDASGVWCDTKAGIGLGHTRLSIIDLTNAGSQPMHSATGRYTIVFNGELYNHLEIRAQLNQSSLSPEWRGNSDTETLCAGFEAWGIKEMLCRTIGMFAIGIWDRQSQNLTLVRDRLGEKPLYYGWQGVGSSRFFLFGSELSALNAHPAFGDEIDRDALRNYFQQMAVPGNQTIYHGIYKLQPGSLLTVSLRSPKPEIQAYWSASDTALRGLLNPFQGTLLEATNSLEILLKDSVCKQMVADAPLGAFLSGGVDSSTVVALMQAQSSSPIRTFTIGFSDPKFNEAHHAKAVADHLGTKHTQLYLSEKEVINVVSSLPKIYSEPFADSSQIPTFIVSALAQQDVKVSLSGDGADELFCGYGRYATTERIWRQISRLPITFRRKVQRLTHLIPVEAINSLGGLPFLPHNFAKLGDRLEKLGTLLDSQSISDLYQKLNSNWLNPEELVIGTNKSLDSIFDQMKITSDFSAIEILMLSDLLKYLPDDILTKVDRASMSIGLETRAPFLDHRLVELAWSLPMKYKLHPEGNKLTNKWILKEVLYRYVPKEIIERPKMGFGVPIASWLRGPLRDWAEDLLSEDRLKRDGYLHAAPIRKRWSEHLSGRRNWQNSLWSVLMFQAWLLQRNANRHTSRLKLC